MECGASFCETSAEDNVNMDPLFTHIAENVNAATE